MLGGAQRHAVVKAAALDPITAISSFQDSKNDCASWS
jgi:hypothetical protein